MNIDNGFKTMAVNAFLNGEKKLAGKPLYFIYTRDSKSLGFTSILKVGHEIVSSDKKLILNFEVNTNVANTEYYITVLISDILENALHLFVLSMIRTVLQGLNTGEICSIISKLSITNKMLFNEYLPRQIIDVFNTHGLFGIRATNVLTNEGSYPGPIRTIGFGKIEYLDACFKDNARIGYAGMIKCKIYGHLLVYIKTYTISKALVDTKAYVDEGFMYIPFYIYEDGDIHVGLNGVGKLLFTDFHRMKRWHPDVVSEILEKSISKHYYKTNTIPTPENIQKWVSDLFLAFSIDTGIRYKEITPVNDGHLPQLINGDTLYLWFCKVKGLLRIRSDESYDIVSNGNCRDKTVLSLSYKYDEAKNMVQYIVTPCNTLV